MNCTHRAFSIPDPVTGRPVEMIELSAGTIRVTAVPDRCMDLYELSFDGIPVSLTDRRAGIIDPSFVCVGTESFSHSFFAGMLTTCGLIQAGRPCEEDGRDFGLHGWISHVPASVWDVAETARGMIVSARMTERHPEGEHLLLKRILRVWDGGISWIDRVSNLGPDTPFMMMYHINFGAPFLSEHLQMETSFAYTEDRDTGLPAEKDEILRMDAAQEGKPEKVYYTRPENCGVRLFSPDTGLAATLSFSGFPWMGVWKNYAPEKYGLGLEPCACPGLGRSGARKRGLLPSLRTGETHISEVRLEFSRIE